MVGKRSGMKSPGYHRKVPSGPMEEHVNPVLGVGHPPRSAGPQGIKKFLPTSWKPRKSEGLVCSPWTPSLLAGSKLWGLQGEGSESQRWEFDEDTSEF